MFSNLCARTVVGLVATLCVLLAACGNDDEGGLPLPTATAGAVSDTTIDDDPEAIESDVGVEHEQMGVGTDADTSESDHHATPMAVESEPADGNDHHNEPSAPSATPSVEVPATEEPEATPSPPPTAETSPTIELEVVGGKPANGVERHRVDVGDMVTIVVSGDTADELHIHGYDLVLGFAPGQPGTITFEANIPGVFEVETHHHGDLVMELQVG